MSEVERERPRDMKYRELEHHQEKPARRQVLRECLRVAELALEIERGGAGEEGEPWRAEVRHPTREEHAGRRAAGGHAGIHPYVIDRHEDHDHAANQVDRADARAWRP